MRNLIFKKMLMRIFFQRIVKCMSYIICRTYLNEKGKRYQTKSEPNFRDQAMWFVLYLKVCHALTLAE
jgi:hypothetical protein